MDNSEMDELRGVPEHMNSEGAGGQGPSTMSSGAATTAAADMAKLPEDIGIAAAPLQSGPTVVVKVASQSVPDIVVEYKDDWTIKDLKQHLRDQHTLHPNVKEQRLIYSGHLLTDDSHLASALRHSTGDRPVLHLVCAPPRSGQSPPQQSVPASPVGAGNALADQQAATAAASSSSVNSGAGTSSSADANLNTATDGVRQRPNAAVDPAEPALTVPDAVNPTAALQQYYAQYYSYINYMQLTGAAGVYGAASPVVMAAWLQQQQQALALQQQQQYVTAAQGRASEDAPHPGPVDAPPPPHQRNGAADAPHLNGPLDNLGGAAAAEDDVPGAGHDWLDSLYVITRFGVLSFFIYFYSTVYRFGLIITVTVLVYLYHAGWFRPARTPLEQQQPQAEPPEQQPAAQEQIQAEQQPPVAPQPQEEDNDNQLMEPAVFLAPNNMDDRNNNIANNNNNELDEIFAREQPYHEQLPAGEPGAATDTVAPAPPSLLMLSWTFLTSFFTSLIPEQPHLL